MNKKNIIILAIVIILLIIGFLVFFDFSSKKEIEKPKETETGEEIELESESETELEPEKTEEEKSLEALGAELKLKAQFFIERYGTYSSDSGYVNLKNLKPFMSDNLAEKVQERIDQGLEKEDFFSFSTQTGSVELIDLKKDENAEFLIEIQEKKIDSEETITKQKKVNLVFINQDGQWKVDEINYQE